MSKQEKNIKKQSTGQQTAKASVQKSSGGTTKQIAKQTKPQKKTSDAVVDVKREQKLQAVLLLDDSSDCVSGTSPSPENDRCGKPLSVGRIADVSVLEYNFEFLVQNGVEEIIVVCSVAIGEVQSLIDRCKWSTLVSIRCVTFASRTTEGDSLRELDSMNIIRSDPFILMNGNVLSNVNLKQAIAFHKQKRIEDQNNVMTVLFKKLKRQMPCLDDLTVAMDRQTSQLLLFENCSDAGRLQVPLELLAEHEEMSMHTDLVDCRIDICSPEFLLQFSDNFDYQDVRRDFIRNEVCNWSLGKHIFGYVVDQGQYVGRISSTDFSSFHGVARDLAARWLYPVVLDSCILDADCLSSSRSLVQLTNYSYKAADAKVSRSAIIGEGVVLGRGSSVADGAEVYRSVISDSCVLSANATVCDSLLLSGVQVGASVRISKSVVGPQVVISNSIPEGSLVEQDLVDANCLRLLKLDSANGPSSSSSRARSWAAMVPPLGNDEDEEDNYGEDDNSMSDEGDDSRRIATDGDDDRDDYAAMVGGQGGVGDGSDSDFLHVVNEMVTTGYDEGHPPDSLLLEIKGCKFAQNKSYANCLEGVISALLEIAACSACESGEFNPGLFKSAAFLAKWRELLKAPAGWGRSLVRPLVQDVREELALIETMESFVLRAEHAKIVPIFRFVLQVAYEEEIVGDEAFERWIALRSSAGKSSPAREELFAGPQVQVFVQWLQQDDDDDEDDDEGSDESSNESD